MPYDEITALYVCMPGHDPHVLNSRVNYLLEFALEKGFMNPMFFIDIDCKANSPYLPEALKIVGGIIANQIATVISLVDYSCGDADPFENYIRKNVVGAAFISLPYHTDNDTQPDEVYDFCDTEKTKKEVQIF